MRYNVTNEFTKISETAGTIQNVSNVYPVEVSDKAEAGSGILLFPLNKFSFNEAVLFMRCVDVGGRAEILVTPFTVDMGIGVISGGTSSSGSQSFNDSTDVDDVFKDE